MSSRSSSKSSEAPPDHPAGPIDFPSRVRQERARLGLTQAQAADLLGVRQQTYAQLETRPDTDPRLSTLVRLIGAGFSLAALAPELERAK